MTLKNLNPIKLLSALIGCLNRLVRYWLIGDERSNKVLMMLWVAQIKETKCLQKAIRRKNKHIKRLQSNVED